MKTEYQQCIEKRPNPNKELCGTIAKVMNATLNYNNAWTSQGHGRVHVDKREIYLHYTNKFETDHDIIVFLHEIGHLFDGRLTTEKYARDYGKKLCGVLKWEIRAWKHAIMLYNLFFGKEIGSYLVRFICECLLTYSKGMHKTTFDQYHTMVLKWLGMGGKEPLNILLGSR
jgi:hypothetical protein